MRNPIDLSRAIPALTRAELIAAVRRYAEANYGKDGWDFLVECWDDAEIDRHIGHAGVERTAIANCRATTKLLAERRSEVQSTEW